jgi:hypothetical protein
MILALDADGSDGRNDRLRIPMSGLTQFWSTIGGAVHPDDLSILVERDPRAEILNRDFPAPAFVGDVDNAPVVILMGNGGYDPIRTPLEFPNAAAVRRYIDFLQRPGPVEPNVISPYYGRHYVAPLIRTGTAVIVNACAYRSNRNMNSRGRLKMLVNSLPSVIAARNWAKNELIPTARSGGRLVIVHRPGLWDFRPGDGPNFHQAVDPEWARKALPFRFRTMIQTFLSQR